MNINYMLNSQVNRTLIPINEEKYYRMNLNYMLTSHDNQTQIKIKEN